MDKTRHNVLVLAVCQALSFTGLVALLTVNMLAGKMLADDPALATLPMALQLTATMFVAIPASLMMAKAGRKTGFILGQIIGVAGGLTGAYAIIYAKSFGVLCVASILLGMHNAFWQFFRFAAVDVSGDAFRPRAIGYVLAGGVVAALIGPEIAKLSISLFESYLYAGTYLVISALALATIIVLLFLNIPRPLRSLPLSGGRPMLEIIRQPQCFIALLSAMCGYGLMMLVMTATPLSMTGYGFEFGDAAFIIQWHTFFMFAPGFFTGQLIKRYGIMIIIMIGAALNLLAMAINLSGTSLYHFWFGLVALGLGWNFMFVGGTTLLTETYQPEERAKVQAFNDFLVFGTAAIASFSSGALLSSQGWNAVNMAISAPAIAIFIIAYFLRAKRHENRA